MSGLIGINFEVVMQIPAQVSKHLPDILPKLCKYHLKIMPNQLKIQCINIAMNHFFKEAIAEGELDFLNQEWVINWNETDLVDYVNGDREPNYLYLVKAILADCERELSSNKEVKELLTAYPNTEYKEDIEIALLRAMQEYIKDIM